MKTARITLFIRWITVLLAALSLASCGGGGDDTAAASVIDANSSTTDNAFTATLTGAQEVPPNFSSAIGAGTVMIDMNTRLMNATVVTAGVPGIAAHIHEARPGVAGPIVFPLAETSPGSGVWTAQTTLSDLQLNILRAGNYYFNVHSTAFPDGEIRGQILPRLSTPPETGSGGIGSTAATTATATAFKNAMTGSQVIPPVTTGATAIGTAAIDNVARTMTVAINTMGIVGIEANAHDAPPGSNGPFVFPLAQTTGNSGIWFVKVNLSDTQLRSVMNGNYYFVVRSAAFPSGELRGQIVQLFRTKPVRDCRFGGFGFDDCTFDSSGFFIGFSFGFGDPWWEWWNGFGTGDFTFIGVNFDGADFNDSDFNGAGFNGSDFNGSDFNGFEFNGSGFNGSDFNGSGSGSSGSSDFGDGGAMGADTPAPGIIF